MPGVPDVYQGSELVDLSLVDPDNRRPVDWTDSARAARAARRRRAGAFDLDDEKLLVTTRALRLRRDLPEVFVGEGSVRCRRARRASTPSPSPARRRRTTSSPW